MEKSEFLALVSAFEHAYDKLSAKANVLSPAELHFIPPIEDAWSINEHLVHLLDADCSMAVRLRGAVAEPGGAPAAWDKEAWRLKNNYGKSDGLFCLDLAVSFRKFLAESLRSLSDEARNAAHYIHPDRGKQDLADILITYTNHADFHLKYMVRNLEAFGKK